jgi:hypothetical protein
LLELIGCRLSHRLLLHHLAGPSHVLHIGRHGRLEGMRHVPVW